MKNLLNITFLLALLPLFTFCSSNDDEEGGISVSATDRFAIHMAVTNNANEDLVLTSESYFTTGDYANKFRFNVWKAYLGEELIQSYETDYRCAYKSAFYNKKIGLYLISLDTDARLQRQMKDRNQKHTAQYLIKSPALFGDTDEHIISLDVQGITDKTKQTFFVEFSISVDGVKQYVYYPEYWEGLYPKDPHGYTDTPYFVLNVDSLQLQ